MNFQSRVVLSRALHASYMNQPIHKYVKKKRLKRLFYFGYSLSKKGACRMPARKIISLRVGV